MAISDDSEPMIAAAQEALGETDFWDARPAILKTDAGAIRDYVRAHAVR
mgnify:CR=1 FL=1